MVFDNPDEARRACTKDRETFGDKFGDRYVRVYPTLESDVSDMQQAVLQQKMVQQQVIRKLQQWWMQGLHLAGNCCGGAAVCVGSGNGGGSCLVLDMLPPLLCTPLSPVYAPTPSLLGLHRAAAGTRMCTWTAWSR